MLFHKLYIAQNLLRNLRFAWVHMIMLKSDSVSLDTLYISCHTFTILLELYSGNTISFWALWIVLKIPVLGYQIFCILFELSSKATT